MRLTATAGIMAHVRTPLHRRDLYRHSRYYQLALARDPELAGVRAYLERTLEEIECVPFYDPGAIPTLFTGQILKEFEMNRHTGSLTDIQLHLFVFQNAVASPRYLPGGTLFRRPVLLDATILVFLISPLVLHSQTPYLIPV